MAFANALHFHGSLFQRLFNSSLVQHFFDAQGSGKSHLKQMGMFREIHGFEKCTSLQRICIPATVEVLGPNSFYRCSSLREVAFAGNSNIIEINGFQQCASLCRIDLLGSVESLNTCSFFGCPSLSDIALPADSHLREIDGFQECQSLCRISIPASVKFLGCNSFYECTSLSEVAFAAEAHLIDIQNDTSIITLAHRYSSISMRQVMNSFRLTMIALLILFIID
jgi:hypothetical protein